MCAHIYFIRNEDLHMSKKLENWKKAIYFKNENNDNPAGDVFRELSDSELDGMMAGGTANTYCHCYSGKDSCGRRCTITTECPIATVVCC